MLQFKVAGVPVTGSYTTTRPTVQATSIIVLSTDIAIATEMYAKRSVDIDTAVIDAPINCVVSKYDTVFLIVQNVTDTDGRPINSITAIGYDANCSDPIQRCPLDKMNFCRNSFNSETLSLFFIGHYLFFC